MRDQALTCGLANNRLLLKTNQQNQRTSTIMAQKSDKFQEFLVTMNCHTSKIPMLAVVFHAMYAPV